MWMTYEEFISMCTGQFLGGLLSIALIALILYGLFKLICFIMPAIILFLIIFFVTKVRKYGLKSFFRGLIYFFIILLITTIISTVLIGISALLANNDMTFLAVICFILGALCAIFGIIFSLCMFWIITTSEKKESESFKFDMFVVISLLLTPVLSFVDSRFNINILRYAFYVSKAFHGIYFLLNIIDVILFIYILLVNSIAKYPLKKSLVIGLMPFISSACIALFYIIKQITTSKTMPIEFNNTVIQLLIRLIMFEIPAFISGLINNRRKIAYS